MRNFLNDPTPRNTTKEVQENPAAFLALGVLMGGSGAIEHQEKQGQTSFVNSETLPTDMRHSAKEVLESFGVKFLAPVEGDGMFQHVELPKGWKKVPSDHSMWSYLQDDKGRNRASIFYKAAFYDRSAHLHLDRRFSCGMDYERDQKGEYVAVVKDCGKEIFRTEPVFIPENREERWAASDKAESEAREWLKQRYPDYENPAAYWE